MNVESNDTYSPRYMDIRMISGFVVSIFGFVWQRNILFLIYQIYCIMQTTSTNSRLSHNFNFDSALGVHKNLVTCHWTLSCYSHRMFLYMIFHFLLFVLSFVLKMQQQQKNYLGNRLQCLLRAIWHFEIYHLLISVHFTRYIWWDVNKYSCFFHAIFDIVNCT